jgi:hypothetical protein
LIDRAFIAVHPASGKRCLVLIQDTINAAGFGGAVAALNKAANLLKEEGMRVLCIANVIGASSKTRSQSNFTFPYILVRDSEIDKFYSVNFAPAIRFLRKRHVLRSSNL